MLKRLVIVALLGASAWALLAWPRINDVTSGKTPEYPDLQDKTYGASENRVAEATKAAIASLPLWTLQGAGKGPGGWSLQAVRATQAGFKHDVTVRITAQGGKAVVKVRSRSRTGPIDFGQNARNIRELFAALDHELH
jgi:uncharacterized protein (DUF1499 family)